MKSRTSVCGPSLPPPPPFKNHSGLFSNRTIKKNSKQEKHPLFTADEHAVTRSFVQREQCIIRDYCYARGGGGASLPTHNVNMIHYDFTLAYAARYVRQKISKRIYINFGLANAVISYLYVVGRSQRCGAVRLASGPDLI